MYHHQDCGGELKKLHPQSSWFRCGRCKGKVLVGRLQPIGANQVKHRKIGRVIRTYYEKLKEGDVNMSLHDLIAKGGKVLVVGGTMNPNWARFAKHPQVVFWNGDSKDIRRHLKSEHNLPDNTRVVITSRFISHAEAGKIIEEARKKRILICNTLNDGEITRKLEEIVNNGHSETKSTPISTTPPSPPTPVVPSIPAPSVSKKVIPEGLRKPKTGEIKKLIQEHYDSKYPNIDEARRIVELAKQQGLFTNDASVAQAIYQHKKELGITSPIVRESRGKRIIVAAPPVTVEAPDPTVVAMPATKITPVVEEKATQEDDLIMIIDDAIKAQRSAILGLELVREQIAEFKTQKSDYIRLKAKLEKLLKED